MSLPRGTAPSPAPPGQAGRRNGRTWPQYLQRRVRVEMPSPSHMQAPTECPSPQGSRHTHRVPPLPQPACTQPCGRHVCQAFSSRPSRRRSTRPSTQRRPSSRRFLMGATCSRICEGAGGGIGAREDSQCVWGVCGVCVCRTFSIYSPVIPGALYPHAWCSPPTCLSPLLWCNMPDCLAPLLWCSPPLPGSSGPAPGSSGPAPGCRS